MEVAALSLRAIEAPDCGRAIRPSLGGLLEACCSLLDAGSIEAAWWC
jgi:hypothetical protein